MIPAYDRATTIGRAIESALRQSAPPFEVIVVDDCSTDDTRRIVTSYGARDTRVRLLQTDRNSGGSAARNLGLTAASGEFVAFLDSDDEWLREHLEYRLDTLQAGRRPALVFGSFFIDDGRRRFEQRCRPIAGDPLEYLYSGRGGMRTSTFAGDRARLLAVGFDNRLRKHQDWDLVLNVMQRFDVAVDTRATAVLHIASGDRLSARLDHASTRAFYEKNAPYGTRTGWALFCTIMLERTYRLEGAGKNFRAYLGTLTDIDPRSSRIVSMLGLLLRVPRIGGRLFRAASRVYCLTTARGRERRATRSPG